MIELKKINDVEFKPIATYLAPPTLEADDSGSYFLRVKAYDSDLRYLGMLTRGIGIDAYESCLSDAEFAFSYACSSFGTYPTGETTTIEG